MSKRATVISFGGIKGGPGKTTLAVNTAIYLHLQGKSVLLIDADHQQSATHFTEFRSLTLEGHTGYFFSQMLGRNLFDQVIKWSERFDYIVIDCHGGDNAEHRAALMVSDIVIIPVRPRPVDFWSMTAVVNLVQEIRTINPLKNTKYLSVLNQADVSSDENRQTAKELSNIEGMNFIGQQITTRKAFARAAARGLGIMEYMQEKDNSLHVDPLAVKEFHDFLQAVLTTTQIKLNEQR